MYVDLAQPGPVWRGGECKVSCNDSVGALASRELEADQLLLVLCSAVPAAEWSSSGNMRQSTLSTSYIFQ